jgi:hypothetical protein
MVQRPGRRPQQGAVRVRGSVALVYQDGENYYEVRAEFDVITVVARSKDGGPYPHQIGTFVNVQKRVVADPRRM